LTDHDWKIVLDGDGVAYVKCRRCGIDTVLDGSRRTAEEDRWVNVPCAIIEVMELMDE